MLPYVIFPYLYFTLLSWQILIYLIIPDILSFLTLLYCIKPCPIFPKPTSEPILWAGCVAVNTLTFPVEHGDQRFELLQLLHQDFSSFSQLFTEQTRTQPRWPNLDTCERYHEDGREDHTLTGLCCLALPWRPCW